MVTKITLDYTDNEGKEKQVVFEKPRYPKFKAILKKHPKILSCSQKLRTGNISEEESGNLIDFFEDLVREFLVEPRKYQPNEELDLDIDEIFLIGGAIAESLQGAQLKKKSVIST